MISPGKGQSALSASYGDLASAQPVGLRPRGESKGSKHRSERLTAAVVREVLASALMKQADLFMATHQLSQAGLVLD